MSEQTPLPGLDVPAKPIEDQSHAAARAAFELMLADVPFGDSYSAIIAEGWPWRDAAYIAWKSMPKAIRQPATEEAFCELIGINRSTMQKRRRKNPMIDVRAAKGVVTAVLNESIDDVVGALVDSATDPSYKHHPDRKMFLEMTGAYTPKQDVTLTPGKQEKEADTMSDDELARQAALDNGAGGAA